MNQQIENRIEANDTSINKLLKGQKFYIDFFQREYRWGESHIKALVEDLTNTFLKSYSETDKPAAVANYQSYYLGPVVFSVNPETAMKSIIDGQQRITSITLLLIYLNNKQKDLDEDIKIPIRELIFSTKHQAKSFNMTDENREPCLKALFETGEYTIQDHDDDTVENMLNRYKDIDRSFPEEIDERALPFFIDWLIENVVVVEIKAYSDENAYTIFETMNDRGLNLTPTEMLKGFVLSKIKDSKQRDEINELWKHEIGRLNQIDKKADQSFFHAWFRGHYANSIRPGKAGSVNQDFELIGSRFHSWFKDNYSELFGLESSDDFYLFFKVKFPFYVKWYLSYKKASQQFDAELAHIYYIKNWGIADSLQEPMVLASICFGDKEETIKQKLNTTAKYIESFTVRRSINYKNFGQTAIKCTMFNVLKAVRNNNIEELLHNLQGFARDIPQKWDAVENFRLHGMNRKFVKHLLCRINNYVDSLVGKDISYAQYFSPKGKNFEIEHIWADKFEQHRDEFEQIVLFQTWRNNIGALILLPQGTNQSFGSCKYSDKLKHYIKENTYAQTLHEKYYERNPNFLKSDIVKAIGFKAHPQFMKENIAERNKVVQHICEKIWDF